MAMMTSKLGIKVVLWSTFYLAMEKSKATWGETQPHSKMTMQWVVMGPLELG